MVYEVSDVLTLNNNNKYVVVSTAEYNNKNYLFLININNNNDFMFVEVMEDNSLELVNKEKMLDKNLIRLFEKPMLKYLKDNISDIC